MSQHDMNIANQGFPAFRADLNDALGALATTSAGATEPSTTFANQFWYDSTANLLKMRNTDNDAWITLAYFDQANDEWEVRTAVIQAVDSAGVVIKTDDGTTRIEVQDDGDVSINSGQLFVDQSTGNVGIGTSSPANKFVVAGTVGNFEIEPSGAVIKLTRDSINYINASNALGALAFQTGGSERMRIGSTGGVAINATSTTNAKLRVDGTTSTDVVMRLNGNHPSFTEQTQISNVTRSANSTYQFLLAYSGDVADLEFNLRGDGQAYSDGGWIGTGADYAEYFEWSDGNSEAEDRRGCTVVLDENMIRKATDEDDASQIIGVISAYPAVVGDSGWNKWSGKHLKDEFGSYIYEEHNVIEWAETVTKDDGTEEEKHRSYEDWNIPDDVVVPDDAVTKTHDEKGNRFKHRKVNPDYDPNVEYVAREDRQEWDAVGLMGKLRIRKGQPVGDRWIKMRDISDSVEEWLVR